MYLRFSLVFLLMPGLLMAKTQPDMQKLREAIAQLEQEVKLTGTHPHEKKSDSSFWPQCKFWAGLCVITVIGQWFGYYMIDKENRKRAEREQSTVDRLEKLLNEERKERETLQKRMEEIAAADEDDAVDPNAAGIGLQPNAPAHPRVFIQASAHAAPFRPDEKAADSKSDSKDEKKT